MLAYTMSETLNTLAALGETLDVLEWIDDLLFSKTTKTERHTENLADLECRSTDIQEEDSSKEHQAINLTCTPILNDDVNDYAVSLAEVVNASDLETIQNSTISESKTDVEKSEDISRDRLLEIVEDKIQQLELECPNRGSLHSDNRVKAITTELHLNETVPKHIIHELNENSAFEQEHSGYGDQLSKDFDTRDNNGDVETNDTKLAFGSDEPSVETENNDNDTNQDNILELVKRVCDNSNETVSSATEDQISENTSKDKNDELQDQKRIKTNVTFSWDPISLIEHLYDIGKETKRKHFSPCPKHMEGYWQVLSAGDFLNREGEYYIVTNNSSLVCYESKSKENILTKFSLQYATAEILIGNILALDSRLGRSIRVNFSSEEEMERWKTNLQSHCDYYIDSNFIVPVPNPMKSHKNVVIIDLGCCSTRAGILMDQPSLPSLFFPTVCATDKVTGTRRYGVEALLPEVRQSSNITFPVRQSAKVTKFTMDVDSLQGLFTYIFQQLNIDPKNYIVQVCVPRSLSTNTQLALVKLLLENLKVQAVSLTRQALLTMYANDISTAIVVDIGDRLDILPVVDGFILEGGVSRLPHGGHRIIHHMKHALAQKHISLSNDIESFVVQHIFENLCYFSENFEKEMKEAVENAERFKKSIQLNQYFKGENILQSVTLDTARFQVPEGLFNPDLWGLDFPGIHKLVHQAIQASGVDMRRKMAESIYVSGGVTLIPGFVERLENEVAKLTLPRIKPQIKASPYRYHMAYLGACRLALSSSFHQACVTQDEWEKNGLSNLNKWHL